MSGTGHNVTTPTSTGNQIIDGLLSDSAWVASIEYSFPTGPNEYTGNGLYSESTTFRKVSAIQEAGVRWILDTAYGTSANDGFSVEGFTNLQVSHTTSEGAHLRFAGSDEPSTAWAYLPGTHFKSGDTWFGGDFFDTPPVAGNYEWATLIHETGHALGLKHGHESDGFGALPSQYDTMEFSIMTYRSYEGASVDGAYGNETFGFAQTFMMADIAALQEMYGANYTTNSGDTVYKWNPNSGDTLVNGQVAIDAGANRIFATIWDGGGNDTYDLSSYSTDLNLDLMPGGHSVFSATQLANLGDNNMSRGNVFNAFMHESDPRSLIENAIGGSGNDLIKGNTADNLLKGEDGNDTIFGNTGNDTFFGGTGNDKLYGGGGNDKLYGGKDDDYIKGHSGNDYLKGHSGNDHLRGGSGKDLLKGGSGNDLLKGEAGNDTIFGNSGNDVFFGGTGNDKLYGGSGKDKLYGGKGDDYLKGHSGNDYLKGHSGDDHLRGGSGNDTLRGNSGNDTLEGETGDDTFIFDAGWDHDTITDFDVAGNEKLDFSRIEAISSMSDLSITYGASNTVISYGNDSITLEGTTATMQVDDFIF